MNGETEIVYAREQDLGVEEFRRVLVESGLGATRPVDDPARLARMLSGANLILTARVTRPGGELAGVARCITDFSWNCYVNELAVPRLLQGLGIGRGLLAEARTQLGPQVSVALSSMPGVTGFYERVGMNVLPDCYWFKREG